MSDLPQVSVVVPVYGRGESLESLTERIGQTLRDRYEIILVDDGNPPQTWGKILELTGSRVVGLRLSKNSGQHAATLAGIRAARGTLTVTIDDDLQNPPEEIPVLLKALDQPMDLVYGTPRQPSLPIHRRFLSRIARTTLSIVSRDKTLTTMSSFRVFRTQLRDAFSNVSGGLISLDVMLRWATSRISSVEVSHHVRRSGKSNYKVSTLIRHYFRHISAYSIRLLVVTTAIGALMVIVSIFGMIWVVGRRIATGSSVDGFPFLATSILAFSGIQLLVTSSLGIYIGGIHQRVINRPSYLIIESADLRRLS